jgi:hypothetical protein
MRFGRIPPEASKVDGCDCKTGNSPVHLVTCSIHNLTEDEYWRRHDDASARVRQFVNQP